MFCMHCGNEIDADSIFCYKCGKKIKSFKKSSQDQKNEEYKPITEEFTVSGHEAGDEKVTRKKLPMVGIFSVVFSSISLIMLFILIPIGITQSGEEGYSTFAALFSLSIVFVVTGIISGLIGLNHPSKMLPFLGLIFGALYIIMITVVVASIQ